MTDPTRTVPTPVMHRPALVRHAPLVLLVVFVIALAAGFATMAVPEAGALPLGG